MITLDDIRKLPEYQKLLDLGYRDITDEGRSRSQRLHVQLEHPLLGTFSKVKGATVKYGRGGTKTLSPVKKWTYLGNYTIFDSGRIRLYQDNNSDRNKRMWDGGFGKDHIMVEGQWRDKLKALISEFFVRLDVTLYGGTINRAKDIAKTEGTTQALKHLVDSSPSGFSQWLGRQTDEKFIETILTTAHDPIVHRIKSNYKPWVIGLKPHYKNPAVLKIIEELPKNIQSDFTQLLGLAGDLGTIGF